VGVYKAVLNDQLHWLQCDMLQLKQFIARNCSRNITSSSNWTHYANDQLDERFSDSSSAANAAIAVWQFAALQVHLTRFKNLDRHGADTKKKEGPTENRSARPSSSHEPIARLFNGFTRMKGILTRISLSTAPSREEINLGTFLMEKKRTPGSDYTGESPAGMNSGISKSNQTRREARQARRDVGRKRAMPRREHGGDPHAAGPVAHIREGNFVTRGGPCRAMPSRISNRIMKTRSCPARNFALYPSYPPPRLVCSASGPITRTAVVYVGISIHRDSSRARSDMSDFTWATRELEKLTRPDLSLNANSSSGNFGYRWSFNRCESLEALLISEVFRVLGGYWIPKSRVWSDPRAFCGVNSRIYICGAGSVANERRPAKRTCSKLRRNLKQGGITIRDAVVLDGIGDTGSVVAFVIRSAGELWKTYYGFDSMLYIHTWWVVNQEFSNSRSKSNSEMIDIEIIRNGTSDALNSRSMVWRATFKRTYRWINSDLRSTIVFAGNFFARTGTSLIEKLMRFHWGWISSLFIMCVKKFNYVCIKQSRSLYNNQQQNSNDRIAILKIYEMKNLRNKKVDSLSLEKKSLLNFVSSFKCIKSNACDDFMVDLRIYKLIKYLDQVVCTFLCSDTKNSINVSVSINTRPENTMLSAISDYFYTSPDDHKTNGKTFVKNNSYVDNKPICVSCVRFMHNSLNRPFFQSKMKFSVILITAHIYN
ncbi:hypothetical protein DBV15_07189, partial [Temnothorax longispinosus]